MRPSGAEPSESRQPYSPGIEFSRPRCSRSFLQALKSFELSFGLLLLALLPIDATQEIVKARAARIEGHGRFHLFLRRGELIQIQVSAAKLLAGAAFLRSDLHRFLEVGNGLGGPILLNQEITQPDVRFGILARSSLLPLDRLQKGSLRFGNPVQSRVG